MTVTSNLQTKFQTELKDKLRKDLDIKNPMQVPRIEKVCINVGIGSYLQKLSSKDYSLVEENLSRIAGQKPVLRNAKLSVSNFKLRQGMPVGMSVTLRGAAAYNFLDKLIHVVYPRVRDFRGVSRKIFDRDGNCSFGFNDHTVFPETIVPEDSRKIHGVQVTVVTSTRDSAHAEKLLESFGFPFRKPISSTSENGQ